MTRLIAILSGLAVLVAVAGQAQADLIVTVTENALGGTNWAFSGGAGTVSGSGQHFLAGGTAANPQPFYAASDQDTDGLTVVAGTNAFNITNIYVRNYGGLSGTNGAIFDGLDFQNFSVPIGGLSIASMNGLVLHAEDFDLASLNTGTYVFDSYYAPYGTDLGTFTLNVGGVVVPEPSSIVLVGLGTIGIVVIGRRKRTRKIIRGCV